jgi:hypothetical protein
MISVVKKIKHLIISSSTNEVLHYFFRKKWSTSLFLQKKMKHLIISSEKNEAPHYFFRKTNQRLFLKNYWGASFFQKNSWGVSFFSEEMIRHSVLWIQ